MVLRASNCVGHGDLRDTSLPLAEPRAPRDASTSMMDRAPADIALRLERWNETGDPSDLWPNVRSDRLAAAHQEITRVTSTVLGGNTPTPQLQVPDPHDQEAIGVAAFVSGMGAFLGYWIDRGLVAAPPGTASEPPPRPAYRRVPRKCADPAAETGRRRG